MTEQFNNTVLQQISDVAWLVHRGKERVGLLNKNVQEHFTYITGRDMVTFNNKEEVVKHFGNIQLFENKINQPTTVPDRLYIKGFEVDYDQPYALDETHPDYRDDLPLYTKIEGSNVYYAAGYYCVHFEKGWKNAHGPKLSTLLKYGYQGPFKTEMEMRTQLKKLNKALKHDRI